MTSSGDTSSGVNGVSVGHLAPNGASVAALSDPYRSLGRYPGELPRDQMDFAAMLRDYLRIFNKRKWLILAVAFGVFAIGTVRTLLMTPLYTSTIRLQIDQNAAKIMDSGSVTADSGYDYNDTFLRTQYELLKSGSLAERVASAARLAEDKDFFRPRGFSLIGAAKSFIFQQQPKASESKVDLTNAAAGIVQGNLQVRPVPGSRLVDLSYSDPNPARSQRIASAYADAFIASNLDKRFEANAYAKTFLEDQIKQLKLRLEQSEKTMLDFAEKEQIVAVDEKSSIAETNLAAANTALGNLASERIKNEQLWRQVDQTDAVNLPQFFSNAVIDGLRAKRNELVTQYQEKLETFKPGYPAMVQINNKIAEIDKQLAAEIKTIRGSLKGAYEASLNQEKELKTRVRQTSRRCAGFSEAFDSIQHLEARSRHQSAAL